MQVGICKSSGSAAGLKSNLHAATSRSHSNMLPADEAAAALHRRLHVSLSHRSPSREHRRRPGSPVASDELDVPPLRRGELDSAVASTLGVPAHVPGPTRARRHRGAVPLDMGGRLSLLPRDD
eukprot:2284974-Prymnesium_polylepis.1